MGCGNSRLFVSTHSRPKAAGPPLFAVVHLGEAVSTHSRPKAAGNTASAKDSNKLCFNTQPPEGGWAT